LGDTAQDASERERIVKIATVNQKLNEWVVFASSSGCSPVELWGMLFAAALAIHGQMEVPDA